MNGHDQFADDLALYALGALSGDELRALEQHLAGCAACRRELEQLRGDAALLALSAGGPAAPQRSRERFLAALGREPHARTVRMRRPFWEVVPILAAAVVVLIAILLWRENVQLRRRLDYARIDAERSQQELQRAQQVAAMLTAPDTFRVTLAAPQAQPQPHGRAIYQRATGRLLFLASNLAPLPPGKTYELWLLPRDGAPIPAGTFKPDARGEASVLDPPLPAGADAKGFAVTIEPEGGSATPTMPIQLVGLGQ